MDILNSLFRKRIGIPEIEAISFESLDQILEKIATTIPFENLCILSKNKNDITKQNLINKILVRNEGGLCYELNTILYFFLLENGFKVNLARARVYDHNNEDYAVVGRTHVIILLTHDQQTYIVDTGFGGNLPLKPVPLSGETVSSFNGEFRIRKVENEHGDHILEMKLKHKDIDWKTGYAFYSQLPIKDISEMDEVQKIINEHPKSSFNKGRLITKLTNNGSLTLTDTSFTQWVDGKLDKEDIDPVHFKELAKRYFEMDIK